MIDLEQAEAMDLIRRRFEARTQFLARIGDVDPERVLFPAGNPGLNAGEWPAFRQSWREVRRGHNLLVVSDGLTDPYPDDLGAGVGFEVGVEVRGEPRRLSTARRNADRFRWATQAAMELAQFAAANASVMLDAVDRNGGLTVHASGEGLPPYAYMDDGSCVLLVWRRPDLPYELNLGGVRASLLSGTLLLPPEHATIRTYGKRAAVAIMQGLSDGVSDPDRRLISV